MATAKYNTYVGMRYVPIFDGEWDRTKTYEPLVIVSNQGNSYTSRTFVPTGVDISNETYWALTGNYNAQVEYYRQETARVANALEGCIKVYDTVDDMSNATDLQDGNTCRTLGKNTVNDGLGMLYHIRSTAPLTRYIELDNGLYAEIISLPMLGQLRSNGNSAKNWIADCVANWMNHASEIRYEGDANLFFDDTHQINGYWSLTCSIFAMAVAYGIDFDHSKYNNLSANEPNPWAYKDDELLELMRNPQGFYSDDILPYFMAKGYAFKPESNFSNVETGDILFFANGTASASTNFLGIDHCSIFAYHNNDNIYSVWEVGSDTGPVQDTYTYASSFDKCLYVVRLPYANCKEKPLENLMGQTTSASTTGVDYIQCPVSENFVVGDWYTFVCKATNISAGARPALYTYSSSGNIVSYYGGFTKTPYDDIYIMPFRATAELPGLWVFPRFVSDGANVSGDFEWVEIVKGFAPNLHDFIGYYIGEKAVTDITNKVTNIREHLTSTHTINSNCQMFVNNRVCILALDLTLTSNVSAWGTLATIAEGYRPLYQVQAEGIQITASGNIRTIDAKTSGAFVNVTIPYIIQ